MQMATHLAATIKNYKLKSSATTQVSIQNSATLVLDWWQFAVYEQFVLTDSSDSCCDDADETIMETGASASKPNQSNQLSQHTENEA